MQEVIQAAYSAFYAGLDAALYLAAFLALAAGLFTVVAFGKAHRQADPQAGHLADNAALRTEGLGPGRGLGNVI